MRRLLSMVLVVLLCFSTGCAKNATSESPTPQPTKTAAEIKQETIQELIEGMTVEEKVGQLLMTAFRQNPDGTTVTEMTEDVKQSLTENHYGGVILFGENLDTAEQTKGLIAELQKVTKIPFFIGIDEEGGMVSRLGKSNIPHEIIPPAGEMADDAEALAAGRTIGEELLALGFNVDFAPVADVNTNPENPVIGTRAFSADASVAAERVGAFVEGLEETGVSGAAKHFPGHGDTATDSHSGEVSVPHTLDRLKEVEFLPFQGAIDKGVDFVMMGHITTPNATTDGLPASLSAQSVGLLRNELGYDGVVITDAMNMGAIIEYYGSGEATVLSILAGVDIVLMPADMEEAVLALREAVSAGRITEARLNESLTRIFSLKYDKGLLGK